MGRNARLKQQRRLLRVNGSPNLDNHIAIKWAAMLEDDDAYSGIDNFVVGVVTKLATRITRSDEICIIVYQNEFIGILWHRCKAQGSTPYSIGTIFLSETWSLILARMHIRNQTCVVEGFAFIFSKASSDAPLELWDEAAGGISSFYRVEPIVCFSASRDRQISRQGVVAFQTDLPTANKIECSACSCSDVTRAIKAWNEDDYSSEIEESRATEFHQQPLAISFTTFKGKPLDDCKPSDVYFSRPASNELF